MFLSSNSIRANCKTIRGIQYVVFSHYNGGDLIHDRIGQIIEDSFVKSDAMEITKPSLLDNDIAFQDEGRYNEAVIESLRERSL